jgi:hypothetical protein
MKIVPVGVAAALAFAAATPAFAVGVQCAKHDQMVGLLAKKFSESPVATGTVNDDRYMQLFVSSRGTWTILVTKTDGQACIVAAGENWEKLPATAKADPAA